MPSSWVGILPCNRDSYLKISHIHQLLLSLSLLLLPLLKQNFVDPQRLKVGVSHDLDEVTLELRRAPVGGDAAARQAAVAERQGAEVGPVGGAEHAALHHPRAVICTNPVLDTSHQAS